jgi:hypothetical protein
VLWFALTIPLAAQAEPYCDPKEGFAPDGMVVELGGRYFKICDKKYQIGTDRGVDPFLRMPFRSSHVTRVLQDYSEIRFLWGRLILRDLDFEYPSDKNYTSYKIYLGDMILAGARYKAYGSKPLSETNAALFEKGILPTGPLLVYAPIGDAQMKPHILLCTGDLRGSPRQPYDCHIKLMFDGEKRLVAHTRLLWSPVFGEFEPFDFDKLHIFLNALVAVFESIEVTEAG